MTFNLEDPYIVTHHTGPRLRRIPGLGGPGVAAFLRDGWAMAGLAILAAVTLVALCAPWLYPQDPMASVGGSLLTPGQDMAFPLGTDMLGRDIAAGVVHGARVSLTIGLFATAISVGIGLIVGVAGGYFGGWIDDVLTRITELFQTTPAFLLAIVIVILGGPSLGVIVFAIGIGNYPAIARLVRAEFRLLRHADFVAAARSQGAGDLRIVVQEILPNALPPVIATASVTAASSILTESGMAFLGMGDPNAASWGTMIGMGREMLQSAWYLTGVPGLAIVVTILALNLIGDGVNDAFSPRLRQRR